MCHICHCLNIVIKEPSKEERERAEAEEEARIEAEVQRREQLIAQGIEPHIPPGRPRKVFIPPHKVVVEFVPSHDGAPTYAAYEMQLAVLSADPDSPDRHCNSPPSQDVEKHRPPFGIRIYDTTPSAIAKRAALLARRIPEQTHHARMPEHGGYKDRIEVIALPMASSTIAKAQVERCIVHNDAERVARLPISNPAIAASWFIPRTSKCPGRESASLSSSTFRRIGKMNFLALNAYHGIHLQQVLVRSFTKSPITGIATTGMNTGGNWRNPTRLFGIGNL